MRVLVTRPEADANETAEAVARAGHQPIILPLTSAVPLAVKRPPASADAVIFTSRNALRLAPPALLSNYRSRPCFCVGDRTAALARETGFLDVRSASGDGSDLARLIEGTLTRATAFIYPCGRVRRPELEGAMRRAGYRVNAVEVYEMQPVEPSGASLEEIADKGPVDMVLLYSPAGARDFERLAAHPVMLSALQDTVAACISPRTASELSEQRSLRARVAREPTEAAMLELLVVAP